MQHLGFRTASLLFVAVAACSQSQDFVTREASAPPADTGAPPAEPAPAAPQCLVGQCKPTVLAQDQGLDADHPDQQGTYAIATDGASVYFMTTYSELMKVSVKGGAPAKLTDTASPPTLMKLAGDYLYFATLETHQIVRIPKNGGALEAVTPAAAHDDWAKDPQDFVIDGASITWFDESLVHSCDRIPCGPIKDFTLNDPKLLPGAIGVGYGHLLAATWEEDVPGSTGQEIEALGEGAIVETIALDYRRLLLEPDPKDARLTAVFGAASNTIVRMDFPGTFPAQVLASGPEIDMFPAGLSLDATYLYWVNRGTLCIPGEIDCTATAGNVMRVRKDGSAKPEVVLDGQPPLHDLALTPDALYLTTGDGKVLRLPKPAETPLH